MRIAVAAHTQQRVGGVEHYLATVVPSLAAAGHDVACWFETEGAGGEPILPPGHGMSTWTAGERPAPSFDALRAWRPDVVYAHGVAAPEHERALLGVGPAVLFAHSYYGTCISGSKTQQRPASRCCTRAFGPACLLQYYPRRCGGWSPLTMARQYALQRTRFGLLGSYARILVASHHMAGEYARHGVEERVRVVPLPIEPRLPEAGPWQPAGSWRLLYLGRLESAKGAHIALESAAQVADMAARPVRLQMSGAGSLRGTLETRARELMRTRSRLSVDFTGWLGDLESMRALDRADLLLVPSCWPEPFGMVGVEAALRGVPAVAFRVGGIPEWLTDGETGRLVPADPPDTSRFARAVAACLADEGALRRMRDRCRAAGTRFGVASHVAQLAQVLAEAVGGSRGAAEVPR